MNGLPDITALAESLFDDRVAAVAVDIRQIKAKLYPQEQTGIARATPAREQEFTAGREAARLAMCRLGVAPAAIPMGADRAPIWPKGLAGSITHSGDICVVVVGRITQVHSLGIDIETDSPLAEDLFDIICSVKEREWLANQNSANQGNLAKLIFSAKECAYKCQYPISKKLIDFQAFEITLDLANHRFLATFARTVGPFAGGTHLSGRYGAAFGSIMTTMCLPAPNIALIQD